MFDNIAIIIALIMAPSVMFSQRRLLFGGFFTLDKNL